MTLVWIGFALVRPRARRLVPVGLWCRSPVLAAHLAQSLDAFKGLLAFFADLLGSDPSLDFGVGYVGWEVAGEPLANVGRGLEQVARLLPGGRRGEGRSRRGAAVGGGAGGCRRPGEKGSRQRCERGGGGRGKRQVVGCQTWSTVAASCRSPEGRPERSQPGALAG